MSARSDRPLVLGGEFPAPTRDQWLTLVDGVLKGRPFDKVLVSRLYDGIDVQPLYTANTTSGAGDPVGGPGFSPFARGGSAARDGWDVRQRIDVGDEATAANAAIIAELEKGVTSIVLGLRGVASNALEATMATALDGVLLDLAGVVLDAGAAFAEAGATFVRLAARRGDAPSTLQGNIGADPLVHGGTVDDAVAFALAQRSCGGSLRTFAVDATVWTNAGGADAQELGCSIASALVYLRALVAAGMTSDDAAGHIEFRYAIGADQFAGIAKLRAARRLWSRVTEVCGTAQPQHQHAVTSSAMMTQRDPWVNLLRTTIACFAAAVGGADAITVQPFDAAIGMPDPFARRLARNTQSLLLDEVNLGRVTDPAGGSWYVESLTDALAAEAWAWFREIESAGGMQAALASGLVTQRIAEVRVARTSNIVRRKDPITGVSEFPDITETAVVRAPSPAVSDANGMPPAHRYAEAFELLRDRADRAATRPTMFLANLGSVAAHTARSTFAKNFFEIAGVEALGNDGFDSPVAAAAAFAASGATLACICSSDAVYVERAEATARALHDAGAARVYLAGRHEAPLVDEYVFTGCDTLATLTRALDALGLA